MMGDHFATTKGYAEYGETAKAMQAAGVEAIADAYVAGQVWGTPQQILDKIQARRQVVGDYDAMLCMRFAGMPYAALERSLRIFAKHVMPELKSWNMATTMAA